MMTTGKRYSWAKVCSLKAGAGNLLLFEPESEEQLLELLKHWENTPLVLGHGTNIVGSDATEPSCVVRLGKNGEFSKIQQLSENTFRLGCACSLLPLLRTLARQDFGGLAGLCGIPGTLGGVLAMNAGANGLEIGNAVESMDGIDLNTGKPWNWTKCQGGWGYRTSPVSPNILLTHCVLRLNKINSQEELALLQGEINRRGKVTPAGASAGSVFRNPSPDMPAGKLLEAAGCKGLTAGKFSVSQQHANWIVNLSHTPGNAADCKILVDQMRQRVRDAFGIHLQCEWKWIPEIQLPCTK